jgi:peptidoglycan-associated lipoprotein
MSYTKLILAAPLALLLAACAEQPVDQGAPAGDGKGTVTKPAKDGIGYLRGMKIDDPKADASVRTVYFAYDSYEVQPQYQEVIAAHAKYLADNSGLSVTLEGHADERGSREYNVGLGDKRAQTVRRLLAAQAAKDGQLRTLSYGEERPAAQGSDEAAWSKNRRVEIVYK